MKSLTLSTMLSRFFLTRGLSQHLGQQSLSSRPEQPKRKQTDGISFLVRSGPLNDISGVFFKEKSKTVTIREHVFFFF